MQIEELPKLLKESEGIAPSFDHTCWQNVNEIEVEKLDLRGRMGVLLTVREEVREMNPA